MRSLRGRGPLHAVISNVAFAKIVHQLGDLKRGSLDLSLAYSAWPVVDLVQAAHEELGAYPPYVVGVSSDGATSATQATIWPARPRPSWRRSAATWPSGCVAPELASTRCARGCSTR